MTAPEFVPLTRPAVIYAAGKTGSANDLLRSAMDCMRASEQGNPVARDVAVARLVAALEAVREAETRIVAALGEALPAPAVEIRREWRVWVTVGGAVTSYGHDSGPYARSQALSFMRAYPSATVEIEEREITTRVVSRRTVPRTTGEGEGNA